MIQFEWEPLDEDDHLMTLAKFEECVEKGLFIDYDGFGEYASATQKTNKEIVPSDFSRGVVDRSFTHVVWYNR